MSDLSDAQAMLSIVDTAISEYIQGKRRKSLKIGTNEFLRAYDYIALTWTELLTEKQRLTNLIASLSTTKPTPVFRVNNNFPLIVSKHPFD